MQPGNMLYWLNEPGQGRWRSATEVLDLLASGFGEGTIITVNRARIECPIKMYVDQGRLFPLSSNGEVPDLDPEPEPEEDDG